MNTVTRHIVLLLVLSHGFGADPAVSGDTGADAPGTLPALAHGARIEDYLRYAALTNAGLEAAFNRWKAALEAIPQADALPDPRFTYTYYIEEVETRVGPQEQTFGLMQTFPWFGKLGLRSDAAVENAAAAQQEYEKEKRALFYRVKTAWHEHGYLARAVDVAREHIGLVSNLESVARTRFKAGSAPNSAVIQAQVELARLDDRLRSLEALQASVAARLNAALNRPVDAPLPAPRHLARPDVSFTDEDARRWLEKNSPELLRLDHLVRKEQTGIRLARKDYWPDLAVGVDYVDTAEAINPDTADSGKDPIMARVSINLPLWVDRYRAAEQEARLRAAAARATRDETGHRLRADLQLALYHFREAERKLRLYAGTLIPKAEQSVLVARQGFEAGTTGFMALIDAERLLLEFELARRRAQADRGQKLAEIEMLTGRDIGAWSDDNTQETGTRDDD